MEIDKIIIQSGGVAKIETADPNKIENYKKYYLTDLIEDQGKNILYVNKDFNNYTKVMTRKLLEKYKSINLERYIYLAFIFSLLAFGGILFLVVKNINLYQNVNELISSKKEIKQNFEKINTLTGTTLNSKKE